MKKIFFVFGTVLVLGMSATMTMAAPTFLAPKDGTVTIGQPLNDDLYAAGNSIVISKPIQGDLIALGGIIDVDANVSGDVLVMGGTVIIRGDVGDDLRIGGGQVSIYGTVGDDLLIGGGTVVLGSAAVVKGDILTGAGNLTLGGKVLGDARLAADVVSLSGTIGGDADIHTGSNFTINDKARIGGLLRYWAEKENPDFSKNAGQVEFHKIVVKQMGKVGMFGVFVGMTAFLVFWKLLGMFILGLLLVLLLPKYMPKVADEIGKKHWNMLGYGLLAMFLTPFVMVVLAMTVVGIPLAILLGIVYGLVVILGAINGAYYVGRVLVRNEKTVWAKLGSVLVGTLILGILTIVPVVGWLGSLWIMLIGLGGTVSEQWKQIKGYR